MFVLVRLAAINNGSNWSAAFGSPVRFAQDPRPRRPAPTCRYDGPGRLGRSAGASLSAGRLETAGVIHDMTEGKPRAIFWYAPAQHGGSLSPALGHTRISRAASLRSCRG